MTTKTGILTQGLGLSHKVVKDSGFIYPEYEYPVGISVWVKEDNSGVNHIYKDNVIIATFGPNDPSTISDFVKFLD